MSRNHEIIAEHTGLTRAHARRVESRMRAIAGELWGDLDLDDFNDVMERALAEMAEGSPHVLRFRAGPGHTPHPLRHRTPLTLELCEEIAGGNGPMDAAAVHAALLAGHAVHAWASLYRME